MEAFRSSIEKAKKAKRRKLYTQAEARSLLKMSAKAIDSIQPELEDARNLCKLAGLPPESESAKFIKSKQTGSSVADSLSGGYSNTNHMIIWTGHYQTDQVKHWQRRLLQRARDQQPEAKGEERWDKPKVVGSRRRRIERSKDVAGAPPEPPNTSFVAFLSQMTAKWRHDHAGEEHDQTKVVQEISKLWRIAYSDAEREYYANFVQEAREEYKQQLLEFRATGAYQPSERFERIEDSVWVRKPADERNALEREIAGYETVNFRPRPPELDADYEQRVKESKLKRKLKLQKEMEERRKATGKIPRRRKRKVPVEEDYDDINEQEEKNSSAENKEDSMNEEVESGKESSEYENVGAVEV